MTGILEFLLGHQLSELQRGTISFGFADSLPLFLTGLVLIVVLSWLVYLRTTVKVSRPLKSILIVTRALILTVLLFCLLQPRITTSSVIPQESYIALVADNSKSMSILDGGWGNTRGQVVSDLLKTDGSFMSDLNKNFQIRSFRFDVDTRQIENERELDFQGDKTSLAQSLEHVSDALTGYPVSGVILLSDGGDNSLTDPVRQAGILKSRNIPVYTVGVGRERIGKDLEISRVSAVKTVVEGSIFDLTVLVRNEGYGEQEISLLVEEQDQIVASKNVRLGKSGTIGRYTLSLNPDKEGTFVYTVRIPEEADEIVTRNNRHLLLVNNTKRQADILYIEGRPRHEYKFIRRAFEGDKNLRLATYLQTGPRKFLRQGINSPQELEKGFPLKEETLFEYEAIIIGDISQSLFTSYQLNMIQEFVYRRGGGFLILGNPKTFEQNFANSVVADILPVSQVSGRQIPSSVRAETGRWESLINEKYALKLTSAGENSQLMRLGIENETNLALWSKMPQLQGINIMGRAKPGATVLAIHPALRYDESPLPVIVHQRYGRGRTMAVLTASTWRWQMLLPHEDLSHERIWRQVGRWLTVDSPPRFQLIPDRDNYSSGEQVTVRAQVFDHSYQPVNDATIWLKITDPQGVIRDIQLNWNITAEGIYQGGFTVEKDGVYHLEATSTNPDRDIAEASHSILVAASNREYANPHLDATLLKNIADAGGGKYYAAEDTDRLLDDLNQAPSAYSVKVEDALWDMPLIFILLFVLFTTEWILRRRKGMS